MLAESPRALPWVGWGRRSSRAPTSPGFSVGLLGASLARLGAVCTQGPSLQEHVFGAGSASLPSPQAAPTGPELQPQPEDRTLSWVPPAPAGLLCAAHGAVTPSTRAHSAPMPLPRAAGIAGSGVLCFCPPSSRSQLSKDGFHGTLPEAPEQSSRGNLWAGRVWAQAQGSPEAAPLSLLASFLEQTPPLSPLRAPPPPLTCPLTPSSPNPAPIRAPRWPRGLAECAVTPFPRAAYPAPSGPPLSPYPSSLFLQDFFSSHSRWVEGAKSYPILSPCGTWLGPSAASTHTQLPSPSALHV